MGMIQKCDKCKRYYKIDESFQFNKVQINDDKELVWYLCDKCTDSLKNWMKGRILNKETNK